MKARSSPPHPARGFTLLEVMVAVAILGLGLTAILSAQAGAYSSATHARNISLATGLARCKMSELEERIAGPDGFPELDVIESGPCCEGDTTPTVRCAWKIEKPILPEPKLGELDLNAALGSSGLGSALGLPAAGGTPGAPAAGGMPAVPAIPPAAGFSPGASNSDIAQSLAGLATGAGTSPGAPAAAAGAMGGGGLGAIASMAMGMVYPSLKILFESSVRRLTVTLSWREGKKEYAMDLSQWVASPKKAGVMSDEQIDAVKAAGGQVGTSGAGGPSSGAGNPFTGSRP